MYKEEKEFRKKVEAALRGEVRLSADEIKQLRRVVALQRGRKANTAKLAKSRPRTTDFKKARTYCGGTTMLPGSFENGKNR